MATLASSAVSLYPVPTDGNPSSVEIGFGYPNHYYLKRKLKLVLTGQGGATNTITARALGFDQLLEASVLWDATNSKGYPAVIDPVNNILLLVDGSAAPAPVDVTTTAAYIVVTGTPRLTSTVPV